ncbi:tetratricopeptide repeat protein [Stratiformator vulcanicus]|uniref:Photosystem I assembly protein Ycf3 n=1 Tax=Stratiformator vulcanicus TaxID=2527980 RepID=A0A517R1Z8_9PLAN|nr:tetratricopeptide repeat protein [Stratiformator vulcanicus]QDT37909.1 photosystem I assembly protein Ycf3 [Stratiformator vulcanicus]
MAEDPTNDDRFKQARRLIRKGKYGPAIELVWLLVAEYPLDADLQESLASAYFMAGDFSAALRHFERVTKLAPHASGKALVNMGAVYNRTGDHRKAVEVLRRGIAREKRSAEGFYNLGFAHRKLGQNAMAINAYKEAVKVNPEFAEAFQNLGNLYLEMKNFQQARMQFERALSIRPDFKKAKNGLAESERESNAARREYSPFGRLVDPAKAKKTSKKNVKEMSSAQRCRDRADLHDLASELEETTRRFTTALRDELEPALYGLERLIGTGRSDESLLKGIEEFHQSAVAARERRGEMKRKVLELWAHEELQNTPSTPAKAEDPDTVDTEEEFGDATPMIIVDD